MRAGTKRRLLFREVNKAIRQVSRDLELSGYRLFCECERADCDERIEVAASLYDEVISGEEKFVVVPGHEEGGSEDAVFIPVIGSARDVDTATAA